MVAREYDKDICGAVVCVRGGGDLRCEFLVKKHSLTMDTLFPGESLCESLDVRRQCFERKGYNWTSTFASVSRSS